MLTDFVHLFAPRHRRIFAGFVVAVLLVVALAAAPPAIEAASNLRVSAQGDCLRMRASAGLAGPAIGCIPDGTLVVDAGQQATADGRAWTLVRWGETVGWSAAQYLTTDSRTPVATPVPTAATAVAIPAGTVTASRASIALPRRLPPTGGLTVGLVSGLSPRAVVAAQAFEVTSLAVYDTTAQGFLTYIPGSPFNTIGEDPLPLNSAVFIRRQGDLPTTLPAPVAAASGGGMAVAFTAPAVSGTTVGLAGTSDLAALVAAQAFPVESVSMWEPGSQRWLSHIAGAPAFANSLTSGLLAADSVVFVKRTGGLVTVSPTASTPAPTTSPPPAPVVAPVPTGAPNTVSYGVATVTFYYCSPGVRSGAVGDGGGFCGYMANGERVHAGAASCASAYMGQRFLITGDPLNRVYICKDTGGGVTRSHRDIWFANADEGGDWWHQVDHSAEILVLTP